MRLAVFLAFLAFLAKGGLSIPISVAHDSTVTLDQDGEALISLTSQTSIPDGKGSLVLPIVVHTDGSLVTEESQVDGLSLHIRGLLHEHASDLRISLLHKNTKAVIVDGKGEDMAYGEPEKRDPSSISTHKLQRGRISSVRGAGYDYEIRDILGSNLALGKPVEATTSMDGAATDAYRATDGDIFYSVATTKQSFGPWSQVDLGAPTTIGTIMLWTPSPSLIVREVQIVQSIGLVTLAGAFKLGLNNRGVETTSGAIAHDAVAMISDEDGSSDPGKGVGESMQAKLEAMSNAGRVEVARSGPDGTGGYRWFVTFVTEEGNIPLMKLAENSLTAGALRLDSTKSPRLMSSHLSMALSVHTTTRTCCLGTCSYQTLHSTSRL